MDGTSKQPFKQSNTARACRDVQMIVRQNSERILAVCTGDKVAKGGRTGMSTAYTEDMLSQERTMDYIMHSLL